MDNLITRTRTYLDDQDLVRVDRLLGRPVNIYLFDRYESLRVIGVVQGIDRQRGRFKVEGDWFILGDIEGIADVER
ncbi:hypothetical protein D3P09_02165 [Paenibacillus pinisoli]|uniref:YolD-like family protein n=1 Tax=Paenibacillus pinisoli TaxID=1276110 RepID=A0A3A6PRG8_9BACL|nr:hypothetical protein [Paenibacillus pinisoli]RJX40849.1 hypothetical protein D3P09_02165 [Paenibacillus pinisoli]